MSSNSHGYDSKVETLKDPMQMGEYDQNEEEEGPMSLTIDTRV